MLKAMFFNAGLLSIASACSQLLTLAVTMFAARVFTSADFSSYIIFISQSLLFGNSGVFSYHFIVPNLSEIECAALVKVLASILLPLVTVMLVCFRWFGLPFPVYAAVYVACLSWMKIIDMLNLRIKRFRFIAVFRMAAPMALVLFLGTLYLLSIPVGVLAVVRGTAFCSLLMVLLYTAFSIGKFTVKGATFAQGWRLLKREKHCFFWITPSEFLNSAVYHLPILMMGKLFSDGVNITSQYGLIVRLCFGPVGILGTAMSQVFHADIADARRLEGHYCSERYRRIRRVLWGLGALAGCGIFFVVPIAIPVICGDEWLMAKQFARILSPLFAVMIAVSPILTSFYVYDRYRALLLSQLSYVVLMIISFATGAAFDSIYVAVSMFSALACLRYWYLAAYANRVVGITSCGRDG